MYAITVVMGPIPFQLLFKNEEAARLNKARLQPNPTTALGSADWINIKDDFGQEMCVERSKLTGYIFEDMDLTKLAHIERALHQQRMQNQASKAAQSDPGLRHGNALNGPGIISPFPRIN